MDSILMSIEDVLGDVKAGGLTASWGSMLPNDVGGKMYNSLTTWFRIVLSSTHDDASIVEGWLARQHFVSHALVLTRLNVAADDSWEPLDVRAAHLRGMRSAGTHVAAVIDTDPNFVAHAMQVGVTGLLFGHPRAAKDRLDLGRQGIRSWDAIEAEQEMRGRTSSPVETA
jgi:hypothetical protein